MANRLARRGRESIRQLAPARYGLAFRKPLKTTLRRNGGWGFPSPFSA